MTNLDVSTKPVRREQRENPLGLYIAVIKEKPQADEKSHRNALRNLLLSEGYEEFLDAVIDEWERIKYSTAYRAAMPLTVSAITERVARRKEERTQEEFVVGNAKAKIAERLFNIITPNGKPLRECTGAQCVAFGGWYTAIGKNVGNTKLVGSVMTAEAVAALFKASRVP